MPHFNRQTYNRTKSILLADVVLTSAREVSDLAASYSLGTNAYVVKPVDYVELQKAVTYLDAFWARLDELPPNTAA